MFSATIPQNRVPSFDARRRMQQTDSEKLATAIIRITDQAQAIECLEFQNQKQKEVIAALEKQVLDAQASAKKAKADAELKVKVAEALASGKVAYAEKLERELDEAKACLNISGLVRVKQKTKEFTCNYDRRHRNIDLDPKKVLKIVADHTGVTVKEMKSMVRTTELVKARHLACFFLSDYTRMTYMQIAQSITDTMDHTYVINAKKAIRRSIDNSDDLVSEVKVIEAKVKELQERTAV